MSKRREEHDMMDKIILKTLKRGRVRWTDLEKKVLATFHPSATRTRFDNRLRYLLKKRVTLRGLGGESTGSRRAEKNTWK